MDFSLCHAVVAIYVYTRLVHCLPNATTSGDEARVQVHCSHNITNVVTAFLTLYCFPSNVYFQQVYKWKNSKKEHIGIVEKAKGTSSDTGMHNRAITVLHEQWMCPGMQRHTHITPCSMVTI